MLPRDTRKRILENVNKRRNEILEEKILEKQLKEYGKGSVEAKQGKWKLMKEGMQKRREELTKQGILKPLVRYDKKTFKSPLQEMSEKSRAAEIKRIDDQRNKLKSGSSLGLGNGISDGTKIKIKELKLKSPDMKLGGAKEFFIKEKKKKHGFI